MRLVVEGPERKWIAETGPVQFRKSRQYSLRYFAESSMACVG